MASRKKTAKATTKKPETEPEIVPEPAPEPDPEAPAADAVAEPGATEPKPKSGGPVPTCGQPGAFAKASSEPLVTGAERGVRVVNLQNRSIDVTLEHAVYCQAVGRCVCGKRDVFRRVRKERKSREEIVRRVPMLVARSITIGPRGTSEPLHEAVRKCADVVAKTRSNPPKIQIKPV